MLFLHGFFTNQSFVHILERSVFMQEKEMNILWDKIKTAIRNSNKVSDIFIDAWFEPLKPIIVNDEVFVLSAPDSFSKDAVAPHLSLIEEIISIIYRPNLKIQVEVADAEEIINMLRANDDKEKANQSPVSDKQDKNISFGFSTLNPKYVFDSFIVGDTNRFAHSACVAIADKLGGKNYDPLYLYGGSGLGKTHLMHAIGNEVIKNNKDRSVIYITCEQFVNEFISITVQKKSFENFRNKYRNADLLLIDDIQFLKGKQQMQVEVFYTFNTLYELGKNIVLTCDQPPSSLDFLDERLSSRFKQGLTVDIQPPDYETRVAILKMRAEQNAVTIQEDVFDYIASNIASNIRELDGAFNTVIAFCLLHGHTDSISLDLTKKALKDIIRPHESKTLSPDFIIQIVSRYYNVTVSDIMSKRRSQDITNPRQVSMYLCRTVLDLSLKKVGEIYKKDHTTVMHAYAKIHEQINETDSKLAFDIDEIMKRLSHSSSKNDH